MCLIYTKLRDRNLICFSYITANECKWTLFYDNMVKSFPETNSEAWNPGMVGFPLELILKVEDKIRHPY